MRKLFSIIMALLATSALWAYDFQSGDLYYNITSDTTVEVTYQELLSDSNYLDITSITIPEFVEHGGITYSVTSISEYAFTFCSSLSHITIPQSVTKIGSSAFSSTGINKDESNWDNGGLYIDHCLVEVKSDFSGDFSLKEGTRLLATEVFYRSSLKSITIPNSLQNISDRAFVGCDSLSSIIIEDGVNSIGNSAFEGCVSLSSIVIPNSISNIGEEAFFNCSSLRSIVIPEGVTTIERKVFTNCSSLESVTLPNTLKSIKNHAFHACESLDSIQIPNSLTNIGASAFGYCHSLSSISIPNTIDSIKAGTFNDCTNLKSVELPESITSIGHIAFQMCYSLTSITIPKNVRSIGKDAFFQCLSLNSIVVEAINPPSLEETNNHFEIPICYIPCGTKAAYEASDWAQYVGEFVEEGCVDSAMIITYTSTDGNVVTPYNAEAFGANIVSNTYENGVGTITFDGPVISIGDRAFFWCTSLTSITIPNSVTSIGSWAFQYCSSLTSVTIPNSVTSIGNGAFCGCSSLTSMVVEEGNTTYDSRDNCNAIIETATNSLIAGCQNTIIPYSVMSIGGNAFRDCSSLTSITIPNSVTSIGNAAFSGCSALTSMVVEEGNTTYDSRDNCNAIIETATNTLIAGCQNTIIPNSVTSIGDWAFDGCSSLTSITIPNSVTSIGWSAFENTGIYHNEANWENGVLYISNCLIAAKNDISGSYAIKEDTRILAGEAFAYCHSLTSITIPESVTSIGNMAFRDCSSLKSVVWNAKKCEDFTSNFNPFNGSQSQITSFIIGDRVEHIPAYLCYNMASLTSVTIPSSVTSIGGRAFRRTAIYHDEANWESGVLYISNCLIEAKEDISGSYAIKDNTRMLANYAFWNCTSLTSIAIPNSITGIGDWAFGWCSSLTSIAIPNSVTSIGEGAFYGCYFLDTLYIEATTPPVLESNMFEYAPASICYIPCGTKAAYEASGWAEYVGEFVEDCDEDDSTSAIENTPIQSPITSCKKIFRDGQLVIIREGVEYKATGQEMGN